MTTERFPYQLEQVAMTTGKVLNVGCNEDPAGLKNAFPDRVINTDIEDVDTHLQRPNRADVLFDAARDEWPFPDDFAEMVVLGDIVEHLKPDEARAVLREARRVAEKLVITVPEDDREDALTQTPYEANPYLFHAVTVTEPYLRELLEDTGWSVDEWRQVDYFFVPRGYFVRAVRSP